MNELTRKPRRFRGHAAIAAALAAGLLFAWTSQATASPSRAAVNTPVTAGLSTVNGWHVYQLPATWNGFAPKTTAGADAAQTNVCSSPNVLYNENSNKVLEVHGAATTNGATVDQWSFVSGATNEQWCFFLVMDTNEGPFYEIVNQHSHLCLDDYGSITSNLARVDQWACNGTGAQQWLMSFPSDVAGQTFAPNTVANGNQGWAYLLEVHRASTANGGTVDLYMGTVNAQGILVKNEAWCPVPCGG